MKRSLFSKYFLPFIQWYGLMILFAILIDYFLHRLELISIGYYLSYIGTALIIISFIYSIRKRKLIESGSPRKLLMLHEYLAWTGSIFILVHAGIHFNALLPWLAVLMMLIAVASGLVGKFLLKKASESIKDKRKILADSGLSAEEADKKLFFDSITLDLMKKWRVIHLPITYLFGLLSLLHIITIIMFR